MSNFCANCIEETDDLVLSEWDGKNVLLCVRCRDEHPRQGGYFFREETYTPRKRDGMAPQRRATFQRDAK